MKEIARTNDIAKATVALGNILIKSTSQNSGTSINYLTTFSLSNNFDILTERKIVLYY
ncbi:hypothetical protein AGMMS49941_06960 [Deferribacterales bacterium]|nr:hypothetical protein AGMMS49941_06960 [Deferribacterales bacterium]